MTGRETFRAEMIKAVGEILRPVVDDDHRAPTPGEFLEVTALLRAIGELSSDPRPRPRRPAREVRVRYDETRCSDGARQAALLRLREAFGTGRIDLEALEDRTRAALGAEYEADLARATGDLPPGEPVIPAGPSAADDVWRRVPSWVTVVVSVVVSVVVAVATGAAETCWLVVLGPYLVMRANALRNRPVNDGRRGRVRLYERVRRDSRGAIATLSADPAR